MKKFELIYKPFGESAILVEWPQKISKNILNDIRLFVLKIEKKSIEDILELNYIYNSLLVIYKSNKINFSDLKDELQLIYDEEIYSINISKITRWEIPVCYNIEFGIDLPFLSLEKKISKDKIIAIHSGVYYTVFGIGFLPGFLYLGGLPKVLHFPRKNTPRLEVPKGSVGIGGNQTGIYPKTSPGGWQIIGKTPISLFNVKNEIPCVINPGDEIKFKSISKEEFKIIEFEQEIGIYELKKLNSNA